MSPHKVTELCLCLLVCCMQLSSTRSFPAQLFVFPSLCSVLSECAAHISALKVWISQTLSVMTLAEPPLFVILTKHPDDIAH